MDKMRSEYNQQIDDLEAKIAYENDINKEMISQITQKEADITQKDATIKDLQIQIDDSKESSTIIKDL